MDPALRRELAAAVGTSGVDADDVVHPANIAQVHEVLAACTAATTAVAPLGIAAPSDGAVVIAADNLDAILLDPAALLLHTGAAAPWVTVREAASARRLSVSGLPAVRSDTVGEFVGRGELAHRTVAGVVLLTAGGQLISAGGRTLKDVVGYDLAGLVLGSGTRLGLVLAVTLRLDPAAAGVPPQPGAGEWQGNDVVDLSAAFASGAD